MKRFVKNWLFKEKLFPLTPHIIAIVLLCFGLRFGGMYGFYINGDGKGYYAYLPATFIYHDFSFNFINQTEPKYYPKSAFTDFRVDINGTAVNKYFSGTAVLWLPFFLVAHFVSQIFGLPVDGYAPLYQYFILIAAVFYLWLGLLFFRKLLITFNFSKIKIAVCQVLIVFATPVIFYTIYNPEYTHVYSFTLITIFLYYARKYIQEKQNKWFIGSLIILGLIVLVRPINGIVVFSIPFLTDNKTHLKNITINLLKQPKIILFGITCFVLILSIQCVFYYLETGHFIIWSYAGEGFSFTHPHFIDSLFSYRKGLFIYTPITLFTLIGFAKIFKESLFRSLCLLLFLILVVYAISSWDCWWYGMCFSLRPMTEYMPIFAILLAYSLSLNINLWLKLFYSLLLTSTLAYNSVLLYQYNHYILHWDSMDKNGFWKVFLHTSPKYQGLLWNKPMPICDKMPPYTLFDTLNTYNFEKKIFRQQTNKFSYSGKYSIILNNSNKYSPGLNKICKNILNYDTTLFYVSAYICPLSIINDKSLHWVISLENSKGIYYYQSYDIDMFLYRQGEWEATAKIMRTIKAKSPDDVIKIYLWNSSGKKVCVDDIMIGLLRCQ